MLGTLSEPEIYELIERNRIGRLGCNDGENTYVVPLSYYYKDGAIFLHSREGMKIRMMRKNPRVCFEIEEIKNETNWICAIIWGTYEELSEEKDVDFIKQFFSFSSLEKKTSPASLPPHQTADRPHNALPDYIPTVFYRIKVEEVTGRFEKNV